MVDEPPWVETHGYLHSAAPRLRKNAIMTRKRYIMPTGNANSDFLIHGKRCCWIFVVVVVIVIDNRLNYDNDNDNDLNTKTPRNCSATP